MKQFLKMCNVYRRPEGYFLFGLLNTPYGGIAVPPALKVPLTSNAAQLAKAVRKIFGELPDQISEIDLASAGRTYDDHLKEIGFPKPKAFPKKASLVTVTFDREQHEIIPYEQNGRGAFLPIQSVKLASELDDQVLGDAIVDGFRE